MKIRYYILFLVFLVTIITFYFSIKIHLIDLGVSLKYEDWRTFEIKKEIKFYNTLLNYLLIFFITIVSIIVFISAYTVIKSIYKKIKYQKNFTKSDFI